MSSLHTGFSFILLLFLLIGGCAPSEKTISWQSLDGPRAQNISAVLVDPLSPATILVGLTSGDLVVSTDRGQTWEPRAVLPSVYQIIRHPEQRSRLYAATGSGLSVSTDMGKTWTVSPILADATPHPPTRAVTIDPWDTMILYAGVDGRGVWASTNGGYTWRPRNGELSTDVVSSSDVIRIVVHPANPDVLYAIFSGPGVLRSTDAGETWSVLTEHFAAGGTGISNIVVNPANPDIVVIGTTGGDIYRSANGGKDWDLSFQGSGYSPILSFTLFPGEDERLLAGTVHAILISGDFGNTWEESPETYRGMAGSVIAVPDSSGISLYLFGQGAGMIASADSGSTWDRIDEGLGGANISQILPTRDGKAVYATVGKAVYRFQQDSGWVSASTGLPGSSVTSLTFDGEDRPRLYASTASGPYVSADNGNRWTPLGKGMRGTAFRLIAAHPAIPSRLFGETENGMMVSTDRGVSWNRARPALRGSGVRSFSFHPANAGMVGIGTTTMSAVTSEDGGISWDETPYGIDAKNIAAVTFSRDVVGKYFAWAENGSAYVSTNNGVEWTAFDPPWAGTPGVRVAYDHFIPSAVAAIVNNRRILHSSDGGESWVEVETVGITGNVTAIAWDEETYTLYAGLQEDGMYRISLPAPGKQTTGK